MSADEAFDNLIDKNAITIPMIGRTGGTDSVSGKSAATTSRRRQDADAPLPHDAVRVSTLLGEEPSDYHPGADGFDHESRTRDIYEHPTVTDLDPIDDPGDDDVSNALIHGARVLGQDADESPEYGEDGDERRDAYDAADFGVDSVLGMARRVRRFSYLPLAGMEAFENSAREMAVSLVSLHPEQPSLAITSPERGEGRTELAIRFALAVAKRVDYRVLLADFDVRRPQAGARLGISSKYFTLPDVLRGACPLGEALVASEEDNLYVLPSRPSDRDGDEIIDGRQAQGLMGQLHATFDFIIMDCGPVGQTDAMLLCRLAGSAALAGYCGRSAVSAMNDAAQQLEEAGARLAGVLVAG